MSEEDVLVVTCPVCGKVTQKSIFTYSEVRCQRCHRDLTAFADLGVVVVQDFEPYFNKFNEKFLLAKKTYELGAHIISLGSWNIEMIRRECNIVSKLDVLSFPYEPNEYSLRIKRDYLNYAQKKHLKIAVYTKEEGKRIPNILQFILKNTYEHFDKKGIKLDVMFFGLKKHYKVSIFLCHS